MSVVLWMMNDAWLYIWCDMSVVLWMINDAWLYIWCDMLVVLWMMNDAWLYIWCDMSVVLWMMNDAWLYIWCDMSVVLWMMNDAWLSSKSLHVAHQRGICGAQGIFVVKRGIILLLSHFGTASSGPSVPSSPWQACRVAGMLFFHGLTLV